VLLLILSAAVPIDGKPLFPSVGESDSHTRVYYGIVTDGGFCKERWQHRYDMGSSYLQSYTCESPFMIYNSSQPKQAEP